MKNHRTLNPSRYITTKAEAEDRAAFYQRMELRLEMAKAKGQRVVRIERRAP